MSKFNFDKRITRANEMRQDTRQDLIARAVAANLSEDEFWQRAALDDQQAEEQYEAEWRAWLDRWHV